MFLVKPSFEIVTVFNGFAMLQRIEAAGRTCYKSKLATTRTEVADFCRKLLARGHESVIEHESVTVRFIVDRGVSHELVRHRLASFSQESTRFCDYGKPGEHITFVIPPWVDVEPGTYDLWHVPKTVPKLCEIWALSLLSDEQHYQELRNTGWSPQQARSVLPNSTKTEVVMTANIREWRHVFRLRTSKAAHPQMREVMVPLLTEFKQRVPVLFEDI